MIFLFDVQLRNKYDDDDDMPYEMSRDFSHPVSFRVMLSVSVAACFCSAAVKMLYEH